MAKIILNFFSYLMIFIIVFSASYNPSLSCPDQHKQALLQFRSLFTLKPTVNSSSEETPGIESWNSTSDCCQWPLVICNPRSVSRPVISLNLYSFTLSLSQAPNSVLNSSVLLPLFRIRTLAMLDISYNYIQGEIPANGFSNWTRLIHLDLRENHFMGSIPPQIFHLRYLKYLDLTTNLFDGVLNFEDASLQNLQVLRLDENFLTEEIPLEIGNLTQLRELSLRQNRFSGGIPDSILNLKELEILDLSNNSLSSDIPIEIGIRLSNLSKLALNKNMLTGGIPSSLQNLVNLGELQLGNNFLSGDIPIWLLDLNGLKILDLGGNNLTWNNSVNSELLVPKFILSKLNLKSCRISGPIPSWISTQKDSLNFLDLSENQLQGTFPQWLAESELGTIILSDNKFTGSLPPRLFESLSLSVLALSRNNLSGELPANIGNANEIMILMLANNNFSGPVPESLSDIYRLLLLDLSGNQFSGNIFPRFSPDALLAYIDVSRNRLSGEVPVNFGTGTRILALGQNEFSGELPQNLSNMNQLEHLDLQNNRITGELPDSLSTISTLEILNLRNNLLEGPIHESLSNISSLRILDLSSNKFSGSIPQKFGNFISMIEIRDVLKTSDMFTFPIEFNDLVVIWKKSVLGLSSKNLGIYYLLDLSGNQLSGEIPDSLGGLKGLKLLNISRNYKISGEIPESFGDLESIESLDLSYNNLSGEIPQTLANLHQLSTLDVSNNKLVGPIPVGGQMDTMNDGDFANNSGLCGKQIQVPCSVTFPPPPPPPPDEFSPGHESDQTWFSWVGAGIGYPVGLLSAVLASYMFGYFNPGPRRRNKTKHRRR